MARVAPGRTASADEQTTRAIRRTLDKLYAAFSFNAGKARTRARTTRSSPLPYRCSRGATGSRCGWSRSRPLSSG